MSLRGRERLQLCLVRSGATTVGARIEVAVITLCVLLSTINGVDASLVLLAVDVYGT